MEALFGYGNFLLLVAMTVLVIVVVVVVFILMVYTCLFVRYRFVQYISAIRSPQIAKRYFVILSVAGVILSHVVVTGALLVVAPGLLKNMANGGDIYVLAPAIAIIAVTFFIVTPLAVTSRENDRAIGDWRRGISSF
jgi:hypothetical protein